MKLPMLGDVLVAVAGGRVAAHNAGMGEIVNLRRVKKARARAEAAQAAAESRVRHGRAGAAKRADAKAAAKAQADLDGKRIPPGPAR
jgi:hypothetical protein